MSVENVALGKMHSISSASVNEACCLGCDAYLCSCYCFGERLPLASQLVDFCFNGKWSKTKPTPAASSASGLSFWQWSVSWCPGY